MDVFEAAYRVAHDFKPNGAMGLARKMGKNPGVLLNKLNPNQDTHHLTLGEAVAVSHAADDDRIVEAFAWERGGFFVKWPQRTGASDMELLSLWITREQRSGDFAAVVERCYSDGRISEKDWREIKGAGMAYVTAFLELMHRFEGMRDE